MKNNIKIKNKEISIDLFKTESFNFYGSGMTITNEMLKELNSKELQLINSINYKLVREIDDNILIDALTTVFLSSLRVIGSKMNPQDQSVLFSDLLIEIQTRYSFLTIKEVEIIISNGVRQKYGETIGFSILNFNVWTKNYLQEKNKVNLDIQKKLDRIKINKNTTKSPPDPISYVDQLRDQYLFEQNIYNEKPKEYRDSISFDRHWLKNGCMVSGSFLYDGLIKNDQLNPEKMNVFLKDIENDQILNDFQNSNELKFDHKRKIVCAFAIFLRENKKQKNVFKK